MVRTSRCASGSRPGHATNGGRSEAASDLLRQDRTLEEVTAIAVKRVIALQIEHAMRSRSISRSEMAWRMGTSRSTVDRLLDPANPSATLHTLERAARAVERRLGVRLEDDESER